MNMAEALTSLQARIKKVFGVTDDHARAIAAGVHNGFTAFRKAVPPVWHKGVQGITQPPQ
jgi:hypothetical protein